MQVSCPNNIKIYNLSAGKSLPDWISETKRRKLQKNDDAIQRRIELIQDFHMPICSTNIQVSPDGQYIFATGIYKPYLKCFDVNQLSIKFERCLDSEVVKFKILSEDYSKLVLMQCDRYIEFHSQGGRYFRTRIPKYGRDLAYHYPSCDLYFVAAGPEIYRLNLELGRFMTPLRTESVESLCCEFNPVHHLFASGTVEGLVECWDPRTRNKVARLDCAVNSFMQDADIEGIPSITSIKYRDALTFAVGTSTGQVLLYDLRSDKPVFMKDHQYGLPIQNIVFHDSQDFVMSCDTRILKIWERSNGNLFTSIEPGPVLNDLCVLKDTGLIFMANEEPKMQAFYVPSLGPAPKWASFLDNLTEELEENPTPSIFDDYKFATRNEVESLGLTHLIGSNLLKAYMHGFFMDVRLYKKAKSITEPFAYSEYRKSKIRDKIEEERVNRVQLKNLPKVNKALAEKLLEEESVPKKKSKKSMPNLMKDDRFSKMFSNPDFQVDINSDEYRLLNPIVTKYDNDKRKRAELQTDDKVEDDLEGVASEDEDSSDDEHIWSKEVKTQYRKLREEQAVKRRQDREEAKRNPTFYEMGTNVKVHGLPSSQEHVEKIQKKTSKRTLGERVVEESHSDILKHTGSYAGNMEMTFSLKKNPALSKHRQQTAEHHKERMKLRRSASSLTRDKAKPRFWMGQRVK